MDNQNNSSDIKEKVSLNEDQQYQNSLIEKWAKSSPLRKTLLKGIPILLLVIGIPLTIKLTMQQQNINSNAAPDQISNPTSIPTVFLSPTNTPTSTPSAIKNKP